MKKIIGIALVLALAAVMVFGGTVLAWDNEDPCVAANEDFLWGIGWDGLTMESHYGEQSWVFFPTPSDDYNLYRDDVTGTGNLDQINGMYTRTPTGVDLPNVTYFNVDGGLWYMTGTSIDTWYWATEPRGYNNPVPNLNPTCLNIILPNASMHVPYLGKAVDAIDFSDGTWGIHIPAGTWILNPDGSMASSLVVDSNGNIVSDVRFVYNRDGEVTITKLGL